MWLINYISGTSEINWDEKCKLWKQQLNQQSRIIEHEIRRLQDLENETIRIIKTEYVHAPKNVVNILVKEIVNIRKCILQQYKTQSRLKSVSNTITIQISQIRMTKSIESSTKILQQMNKLISVPQISESMKTFSKELETAGIIQEMIMNDNAVSSDEDDKEANDIIDDETEQIFKQIFPTVNNLTTKTKKQDPIKLVE